MTKKLRVAFMQVEHVVLMKVLEQPEDIKRGDGELFKASNGVVLLSADRLAFRDDALWVRGTSSRLDGCVSIANYGTDVEAASTIGRLSIAIREYNQSREKAKPAATPDGWQIVE